MTEFTKQDFELCARILNVKSYEWIMDNFGEEYLEIYDGKVLFKKFDPLNKLSDAMDLLRAAGFSVDFSQCDHVKVKWGQSFSFSAGFSEVYYGYGKTPDQTICYAIFSAVVNLHWGVIDGRS